MCGTLRDKISADLRLEISFDADGFFIWRETNGSAERAPRAIQVWRRNEKFTIDDAWLVRLTARVYIYVVSVSRRSQHRRKSYQPRAARVAAGVCAMVFSLCCRCRFSVYIWERAGMQFQSARVYIRVLCDRQIFIQKSCYITQFAGIHVSHGWRLDGCAREQVDKRERSGESQSNWGKI